MYEELVKRLRAVTDGSHEDKCDGCPYDEDYPCCVDCLDTMLKQAADAIEELSLIAESNERSAAMWAETAGKAVEQIPRWIPVTERLPEEDCQVLAYYGFDHGDGYLGMTFIQVLDYYARDPAPHFQYEGLNGMRVSHWLPLPEPPEVRVIPPDHRF